MNHYLPSAGSLQKLPIRFSILLLWLLTTFAHRGNSQVPSIVWDKTIGGSQADRLGSVQQTSDGGYILGGYSESDAGYDKSQNQKGDGDYWMVKLNASGNKQWDRTIGAKGEIIQDVVVQQTSDGGYIVGGTANADAGFDKSEDRKGGEADYWVVKLDASGNKQWDKTIGGNDNDFFSIVRQTTDGGYILGGFSLSGAGFDKSENPKSFSDYWIVKLDAAGNKKWDKTIGGSGGGSSMADIWQTSDGGYILGGSSTSNAGGDKSENLRGGLNDGGDFWVVKLDAGGNKQWDKTIGGSDFENLRSIQQTANGGYILGGFSTSKTGFDKSENSKGGHDYWIVKLNANGIKAWDKTIGGSKNDQLSSLQQTADGGYILQGASDSPLGMDKTDNPKGGLGRPDYWVVKLDASGKKQWDKTIGGNDSEFVSLAQQSIQQTADGGYILGGSSFSAAGSDKTESPRGFSDYWVVKLSPEKQEANARITSFTLVNADTEAYVGELKTGDKLSLAALGNPLLTVQANTVPNAIDKVVFELSSPAMPILLRTERTLPYTLYGDGLKAGIADYWGEYWKPGQYTLKATPYWQGKPGNSYSVTFQVTGDLPPALRVNFGKAHTPAPEGWNRDYGLPFGIKGNYTYGWKSRDKGSPVDLSVKGTLPGNGRWRPLPSDLLLATLLHMQGNDVRNFNGTPVESFWEVAVENGEYQVTVSVGDGSIWTTLEAHSINVEGKSAIHRFFPQGAEGSISRFKQATVRVKVTDGYLTLDADGGTNTKINYVIVQPLFSTNGIANDNERASLQQITASPNPFSQALTLQVEGMQGQVIVVMHDVRGNIVYQASQEISQNGTDAGIGLLNLDVSAMSLQSGLYTIRLTSQDGSSAWLKVIKY